MTGTRANGKGAFDHHPMLRNGFHALFFFLLLRKMSNG
jgi:hypothetical protein